MKQDDTNSSALPRYYQVSNILAKRISDGIYPVGGMLPTEIELCEEFEISRYTVREALRRLTEDGLVRRRQGSGSQVIKDRADAGYVHSMRSLSELFQYASETRLEVTSVEMNLPPPDVVSFMAVDVREPWVHLQGVRRELRSNTLISFTDVFINPKFDAITAELSSYSGAIYDLIEARYDVTVGDVEQQIRAHPIPRTAARALGVSVRSWSVQVTRRYESTDGQLMQVAINDHPGERFSYKMHLRREGLSNDRA